MRVVIDSADISTGQSLQSSYMIWAVTRKSQCVDRAVAEIQNTRRTLTASQVFIQLLHREGGRFGIPPKTPYTSILCFPLKIFILMLEGVRPAP